MRKPRGGAANLLGGVALNNTQKTFSIRRYAAMGAAAVAMGAGLCATSRPAAATDSGLGFYPTADIYPNGNFHFDYDTFGRGLRTDVGTSVGLEYGFGKGGDGIFGRNEIGFDYLTSSGAGFGSNSAEDRISLNFKTQLYNNDESGTRLAIGVSGLGAKQNFGAIDARLLGYKTFSFGRVHAGVWRAFGRAAGVDDTSGLQLGFDRSLGKRTIIGIDWRSGPTGFAAPCIIYNLNDKAGIELAIGRANSSNVAPRYQTYLAFDYNFDFNKSEPEPVNPSNLNTAPGTANPGPNP